jgi:hypothetical protein
MIAQRRLPILQAHGIDSDSSLEMQDTPYVEDFHALDSDN